MAGTMAAAMIAWRSCCCLAPFALACGTRHQTWTSLSRGAGATDMGSCWKWWVLFVAGVLGVAHAVLEDVPAAVSTM